MTKQQKIELIRQKCNCGRIATRQTVKGKQNEEAGGLHQNNGWYCDKCWKIGEDLEKEVMYGY